MRIKRAIIIPAILALGAAGSNPWRLRRCPASTYCQRPLPRSPTLTFTGELTWRTTNGLLPIPQSAAGRSCDYRQTRQVLLRLA